MAAQAGLCLAGSETPEDMFCHDKAHLFSGIILVYDDDANYFLANIKL